MKETKTWVKVTKVENVPLREGRSIQLGEHTLAIFNLGDRFLAVENSCPHRGGPLADGIVSAGMVVCPLHAWKIDLTTGSVINQTGHAACARTFRTRVQDGVVAVEIALADSRGAQPPQGCIDSIFSGARSDQVKQGEA